MEDKSADLIIALKAGRILCKHYSKEDEDEFLFMNLPDHFEMHGWGTAYGKAHHRLKEIILHPELWEVHPHLLETGYPFPWSAAYKK